MGGGVGLGGGGGGGAARLRQASASFRFDRHSVYFMGRGARAINRDGIRRNGRDKNAKAVAGVRRRLTCTSLLLYVLAAATAPCAIRSFSPLVVRGVRRTVRSGVGPFHATVGESIAFSPTLGMESDAAIDDGGASWDEEVRPGGNDGRPVDRRPHEQRTAGPRKARRLNHGFQHLYRREDPLRYPTFENVSDLVDVGAAEYLIGYGGYDARTVEEMNHTFPPLLDLDVRRHLHPKLRFLKFTLGGVAERADDEASAAEPSSSGDENATAASARVLSDLGRCVPPQYYGARLERTVAPRHTFFAHMKLPHGPVLLEQKGKLCREFLVSSRRTKHFCALCNTWRRKFGVYDPDGTATEAETEEMLRADVTPRQVEAFDALFQRGLMAAARDDMDNSNITQHSKHVNITSAQMIKLLVRHGANPLERDVRGVSLVHWAAGCGNLDGLAELIDALPGGMEEAVHMKADRDGATLLHWAAAGAKPKEFGCGGHVDVCRYILESCDGDERDVVNALTKDGNSVLMWAAWSSALDVVKLLVRHRADSTVMNRNGCSIAHWAASGGNLDICRYLAETVGVDFTAPNYAGNTPLSHAVAYGRADIVQWLQEEMGVEDDEGRAGELAWDFVGWSGGQDERREDSIRSIHGR